VRHENSSVVCDLITGEGLVQCGATRGASRVKVRPLAQTDGTVPETLPEALKVKCGRVEDAAVVPDRCDQALAGHIRT